jgi:hypothetical protein
MQQQFQISLWDMVEVLNRINAIIISIGFE